MRKIFIVARAYHQMGQEVRRYSKRETGGIIMGYAKRDTVIITNVTGSGPHAIHTRSSLKLDERFCRLKVLHYRKQNKKLKYLGDWHSHPSNILKPSKQDKITFLQKKKSHYDKASPMMIITNTLNPITIKVFVHLNKKVVSMSSKLIL